MKITVTGGCGFIGSNFVHYLLKKYTNIEVNVIDCLSYAGYYSNLPNDKRITFRKRSICDNDIDDAIIGSDIVVNFAAETHVDNSIKNADVFIKQNVYGTYNLITACKRTNIPKFIQISTDEVYGDPETFSTEDTPLNPNNPYAASKASAELFIRAFDRTYNYPVITVRMSNNYGPRQHVEKFIPKIISNALKNEMIPVYGNGENKRDWLYVDDACAAIDTIMNKAELGEIYNISAKNIVSNVDIVKQILYIMGKPEDLIQYVEDRPGHDKQYLIEPFKLKYKLGWTTKCALNKGLEKTIEWYRGMNV